MSMKISITPIYPRAETMTLKSPGSRLFDDVSCRLLMMGKRFDDARVPQRNGGRFFGVVEESPDQEAPDAYQSGDIPDGNIELPDAVAERAFCWVAAGQNIPIDVE